MPYKKLNSGVRSVEVMLAIVSLSQSVGTTNTGKTSVYLDPDRTLLHSNKTKPVVFSFKFESTGTNVYR